MSDPERTCVGCRAKRQQTALVRLVSDGDGGLLVGRNRAGRGAWICSASASDCFAVAMKRNAFARALRTEVRRTPPPAPLGPD